ncbi:MAG: hypothetical protein ACYSVY_20815 [Planctomycetota bacterium]
MTSICRFQELVVLAFSAFARGTEREFRLPQAEQRSRAQDAYNASREDSETDRRPSEGITVLGADQKAQTKKEEQKQDKE